MKMTYVRVTTLAYFLTDTQLASVEVRRNIY